MALNLIVLGAPGAGKGTQAEQFARTHGIPKVSMTTMTVTGRTHRRRWLRIAALLTMAIFLAFLLLRRGRLW